jgi:hypothetical protein
VTSRAPALIDWLVSAFTAAATLGQATPPVTVFDGPPTTDLDPFLKLYVGLTDPDNEAIEAAATFTQSRSDMGGLTRDEISEIHCCAEAWSGTDDLPPVRHAAAAIVAAAEIIVRSDTTQFGGNAALAAPGVATGDLLQNNTTKGAIARIPFSIIFKSFT